MGLTITGRDGEVWTSVTGADYAAEKKSKAGEAHPSPAASQEDPVAQDTYVTQAKVWGPDNGRGLRHLLYPKGARIAMAEAIALGLIEAPVEVKVTKARKVTANKGAATRTAPKAPSGS